MNLIKLGVESNNWATDWINDNGGFILITNKVIVENKDFFDRPGQQRKAREEVEAEIRRQVDRKINYENSFIKQYWNVLTIRDICLKLNISEGVLKRRCEKMGLPAKQRILRNILGSKGIQVQDNKGRTYNTITEAARELNLDYQYLLRNLRRNKRKKDQILTIVKDNRGLK